MRASLITLSCVLALGACAAPHPNAIAHVPGGTAALYVSPARSGERNDVRIELSGTAHAKPSSITVSMPDMGMPAQRFAVTESGAGRRYAALNVRFTMAGLWHVSLLGAGGRTISSFEIQVR